MSHYVYKYVLNNEIIYIGKTDGELKRRLSQHGVKGDNIPEEGFDEINKADVYYCTLVNSVMTDVVESELIRRYKPKYNKAKMSEWDGLLFEEPKWTNYKDYNPLIINRHPNKSLLSSQELARNFKHTNLYGLSTANKQIKSSIRAVESILSNTSTEFIYRLERDSLAPMPIKLKGKKKNFVYFSLFSLANFGEQNEFNTYYYDQDIRDFVVAHQIEIKEWLNSENNSIQNKLDRECRKEKNKKFLQFL